jgi:DivIVA domain-containing protein
MTWFFAILLVLALGGVAMVASGWGTPLAKVYDDRPDVDVPVGRKLTGDDLRRVRFGVVLRGYRMSEVDELLSRVAGQLEAERLGAAGEPEQPATGEVRGEDD